jgi:drug/metabolite transporter (DMT)-like permease
MIFDQNKKYLPIVAFVFLCLIWSSTWMAIKLGLWSLPPFLSAGIRFFLAFIFLFLFAIVQKIKFPQGLKSHLFLIGFGLVNYTGNYIFVYWGQQYIDTGLASVLFSVMPFFVLFLSIWFLPEDKITLNKIVGVIFGFWGVLTIFGEQLSFAQQNPLAIFGMVALIIGPFFASVGTVTAKRVGKKMHPTVLVTLPMLYTSLSFFILYLIFERDSNPIFDFNAIFSLLYLSLVGTATAFVIYFWILKRASAVMMSMITFITPPMALFWGWLLMGEHISIFLIVGMILILIGIYIVRK